MKPLFLFSFIFAIIFLQPSAKYIANSTIENVSSYIQLINESGFLVFHANLTQAYYYLSKAQKELNQSPTQAIADAQEAKAYASQAYEKLNKYRAVSAGAMLGLSIAIAGVLTYLMKRPRQRA